MITDVAFHVLDVFSGSQGLTGSTVTVRRPGGRVTLEGKTVLAWESDFPPFGVGDCYFLFLKEDPKERVFVIPYGAQGVFANIAGTVSQVSVHFGTWNEERGALPYDEFLAVLREELRTKN